MARKVDIEYIRYYSGGSEARQLELHPQRRKAYQPIRKARKQKKQIIYLDPLAICGTVVAVCLLIMMVAGTLKLHAVTQREQQMEQYVQKLQAQNTQLQDTYHAGYDLEQIEEQALALGLVPKSEVQQITIQVEVPTTQAQEEVSWLQSVFAFLTGLFA